MMVILPNQSAGMMFKQREIDIQLIFPNLISTVVNGCLVSSVMLCSGGVDVEACFGAI